MNKNIIFIALIFGAILIVGYIILKESGTFSPCNKVLYCSKNEDCQYVWFTGGCYNPEYVGPCATENAEHGYYAGEAPPREGVTCTCENNKCITHG